MLRDSTHDETDLDADEVFDHLVRNDETEEEFSNLFEYEESGFSDSYTGQRTLPGKTVHEKERTNEEGEKNQREDDAVVDYDLLLATAERRAEVIARESAVKQTTFMLQNDDFLADFFVPQLSQNEDFKQDVEQKAETLVSSPAFLRTDPVSESLTKLMTDQIKTQLSDEKFVTNQTKIVETIGDVFGIAKHSIPEIDSKVQSLKQKTNSLIRIQKLQTDTLERAVIAENVASVLLGVGIILFAAGIWIVSAGHVTLLLRGAFSIPLGILGIGLLMAGGHDLLNRETKYA